MATASGRSPFWRGRYFIIAGHYASGRRSRLYDWAGHGQPRQVSIDLDGFNAEGFFTPESSGCYVISEMTEVPDKAVRAGHVEDYIYAGPKYFTPEGGLLFRGDFFAMGPELGFELV